VDGNAPETTDAMRATGRKAETQARILDAAIALFAARGYDGTSIASIAEQAGVSRSAVFWHFSDKESLFQEAFRRMLVPFAEQFKASVDAQHPSDRMFELFEVYEEFVAQHREEIEPIVRWILESPAVRASLRKPLLSLLGQFVQDVCESLEPVVKDPQEAQSLAAAMVSLLNGNLVLSFVDPNPKSAELRSEGLRRVARRMLSNPPNS
jgi:AcrR family transcriptional regulator